MANEPDFVLRLRDGYRCAKSGCVLRDAQELSTPVPKGRINLAQGNALGSKPMEHRALKGRFNRVRVISDIDFNRPFRAVEQMRRVTQGAALDSIEGPLRG